jgi:hypothetical protein
MFLQRFSCAAKYTGNAIPIATQRVTNLLRPFQQEGILVGMKTDNISDEKKKSRTRRPSALFGPFSKITPKEREALWLIAGLFLLGLLVRAYRTYGGF